MTAAVTTEATAMTPAANDSSPEAIASTETTLEAPKASLAEGEEPAVSPSAADDDLHVRFY
jgi:hypothetical protein